MKAGNAFFVLVAVTLASFLMAGIAPGQNFGLGTGPKGGNDLGGGVGIGIGNGGKLPQQGKQVIKYTETIVGDSRQWTNSDGKQIVAYLVAYPKAPDAGKFDAVEIIKEGKIRLLVGEDARNVVPYPLENLSEEDQEYISNVALNLKLSAKAREEAAEKEAASTEKAGG